MKYLIFITTILTTPFALAENKPVLTVYAPDYFTSEWGPGPSIEIAFEEICNCDLKFSAGDILPRLILEGSNTKADIVIGLNTDVTKKAIETGLFTDHGQDNSALELPIDWTDKTFLPFDWSYVAFIFDEKTQVLPKSFEDLVNLPDDTKIVIQDPRTSISGLALILWVKSIYGDQAEDFWARLRPKILTVTKGWSEAYGLFTDGEAQGVLSFTTSPAYHIAAENDMSKKAAIFDEGHYPYFELAAKLTNTKQPELADQFMAFILSDNFQNLIPMTNWSYPSAQPRSAWPELFSNLPIPEKVQYFDELQAQALSETAVEEWRRALSK
jgi:thiamine transport system substrate-binding protein